MHLTPLDRARLEKAGADCGFELTPELAANGALVLRSAHFPESVAIKAIGGSNFHLTASNPLLFAGAVDSTGEVQGYSQLYGFLQKAAAVARTLPNRVADEYRSQVALMPKSTEAERLVVQRVGQDIFRAALLDYWRGTCCVTGLSVRELLRASHMMPWAKCECDEQRLDVFNGLLLAPHVDALFDGGWISFDDSGRVLISEQLTSDASTRLGVSDAWRVRGLTMAHLPYLRFHRDRMLRRH